MFSTNAMHPLANNDDEGVLHENSVTVGSGDGVFLRFQQSLIKSLSRNETITFILNKYFLK
jgi:hypothetical protein